MLFVTWVATPFRPTRDLDLLGSGDNGAEAIAETFRGICAQPVADDGVIFDVAALEAAPIREELEYGGVRVRTTATIAGARIPIQVDIGFGLISGDVQSVLATLVVISIVTTAILWAIDENQNVLASLVRKVLLVGTGGLGSPLRSRHEATASA